jgi:hypothetical protein
VFVNAEQVLGATPALDALLWRWHEREARARGATDEQWAAAVERMTHDRCATVETNLELLRSARLEDVSVHFADGRFAVFAGRRSAVRERPGQSRSRAFGLTSEEERFQRPATRGQSKPASGIFANLGFPLVEVDSASCPSCTRRSPHPPVSRRSR